MKYRNPEIEIIEFDEKASIVTMSVPGGNIGNLGGDEGTDLDL